MWDGDANSGSPELCKGTGAQILLVANTHFHLFTQRRRERVVRRLEFRSSNLRLHDELRGKGSDEAKGAALGVERSGSSTGNEREMSGRRRRRSRDELRSPTASTDRRADRQSVHAAFRRQASLRLLTHHILSYPPSCRRRPRGVMANAFGFEPKDCRFESGRRLISFYFSNHDTATCSTPVAFSVLHNQSD